MIVTDRPPENDCSHVLQSAHCRSADGHTVQPFPVGEMGEAKPVFGWHSSIRFPFSSLPAGIELSWQR